MSNLINNKLLYDSFNNIFYKVIEYKDNQVCVDRYETLNSTPHKTIIDISQYDKLIDIDYSNELDAIATRILAGEIDIDDVINSDEIDDCTDQYAIALNKSKVSLEQTKSTLETQCSYLEQIQAIIKNKIKEQEDHLRNIRLRMQTKLDVFRKEISRVMQVIQMIELYCGIEEELLQLTSGEPADINEPISFRQQVLFMDEEVGDPQNDGIDFSSIDKFDEWLISNNNFKKFVPEQKCVVACKPRRYDKDYGEPVISSLLNVSNKITYFIIRNGDNLYRISSTNISINNRLFPKRDEFQKFNELISNRSTTSWDREKCDRMITEYKRLCIFCQGLIDRTSVFHPMKLSPSIFELDKTPGAINLIYDDEFTISDGAMPYAEWKENINSKISRGSRIVVSNNIQRELGRYLYSRDCRSIVTERFVRYTNKWYDIPTSGIYEVQCINEDNKSFNILYMPDNESWYGDRKNRIGFIMYRDDSWIINYDMCDIEIIDYYLNSRVDRHNYLSMIPTLWEIRRQLVKEMEMQDAFIAMMMNETGAAYDDVLGAVDWWKLKNIWKRPITKDDAKAYRMIKNKLIKNKQ